MTPPIDPIKATADTTIKTMLKICRTIHFVLQASTFLCFLYISTGKYIANGHRFKAPKRPSISLKYGNTIEIPVVDTTYAVLNDSLNRFSCKSGKNGSFKWWIFVRNTDSGNFSVIHLSTYANTG